MRDGRPAQMILAAFDDAKAASNALNWLEGQKFKSAGFSVIAPEDAQNRLSKRATDGMLPKLLADLSASPKLSADDGPDLVGAGALAELLEPSDTAMPLPDVLQKIGLTRETTETFEQTLSNRGLIVAAAAEDTRRGEVAENLMRKARAVETSVLEVPNADARP